MLAFAMDNPPPATIVIITGDRDFAYATSILKMRGYKVIVICAPHAAHASLKIRADGLFDWQKDVARMNDSEAARAHLVDYSTRSKEDSTPRNSKLDSQDSHCPIVRSSSSSCLKPLASNKSIPISPLSKQPDSLLESSNVSRMLFRFVASLL